MLTEPRSSFLLEAGRYALDPVVLQRIFLILVRAHYSDPNHFGSASKVMEDYRYAPEPEKNRINIIEAPEYGTRDTDFYPAITINCGGAKFEKHVIGDMDPAENRYGYKANSQIDITHYAHSAREALTLGNFTTGYIIGYQRFYLRQIGASRLVPGALSPAQLVKGNDTADQVYSSTFSFAIDYDYSWTATIEAHLISGMSLQVAEQLGLRGENG